MASPSTARKEDTTNPGGADRDTRQTAERPGLPELSRRTVYPRAESMTPADRTSTPSSKAADTYVVKDGQTFWSIARELKIPLEKLLSLNPKIDPKKLHEGVVLNLKEVSSSASSGTGSGTTTGPGSSTKPPTIPPQGSPEAPSVTGGGLEPRLHGRISEIRSRGVSLTPSESTSWMVYDLSDRKELASINADTPRAFASMVKPFVAVAFFHEVNAGRLTYGPESKAKLEAMLRHSDNAATNWFIDKIGGAEKVERILKANYPEFTSSLDIVQKIPGGGSEYLNTCSARDCARLLVSLRDKKCAGAEEIHRVMNLSSNDRLVDGTGGRLPDNTNVMHKTGSTAKFIGDMGILSFKGTDGKPHDVIVVGMVSRETRDPNYKQFMRRAGNVIREVSVETYRYLKGAGKVN